MIGMALETKYIIGNLYKKVKEGCINCSFNCRRHFKSCTLVTKWNVLILMVGVA